MTIELSRPNVKSSKQYEVEGSFELWDQLGLEVLPFVKDEVTDEIRIPSQEHTYTVRVKPLSLKERLAVLFGKNPECIVTDEWTEVVDTAAGEETPLSEDERKAQRSWILNAPPKADPSHQPTPKEQGEEVKALVENFDRHHNPALIEAIKQLPEPEEVLLRFKRPLTNEERKKIKALANGIVYSRPVSVKVSV